MDTKTLAHLACGASATVLSIKGDELRSKLLEMGLTPGSLVTHLYHAPFGDPIAIEVDGYVLSMRKQEAALIEVKL